MEEVAPPEWAALVQGRECHGAAEGKCRLVDGVLVVEGVTVEAASFVGLRVQDPAGPIEVRGLRVFGTEIGIDIHRTCAACSVTVTDAELHARSVGVRLGEEGSVEGAVALHDTRILTGEQEGTYLFAGATLGIYARNQVGPLRIENATLEAATETPGSRAIWNRGDASIQLTLTNVELARYGRGITGDYAALTFRNVSIACVYDAVYSTAYAEVDADGLTVDGCGKTIPDCTGLCGTGLMLFGPSGKRGGEVNLRSVTFSNNSRALFVQDYRELRMEGFRIIDGTEGLSAGVTQAVITNGTVARQSQHGMRLGVDQLSIRGVAFLDNGHSPLGNGSPHAGLEVMGGPNGPRSVTQSTFTGNVPFGVKSLSALDARFNWWGSPAGPSLQPAPDGKPLPGFGDAVTLAGMVLTEPHLVAPP